MKDFGDMLKKASEVQSIMRDFESELRRQKIEGESGGGLVKVEMNGQHDVYKVTIDESLMDDREILEDLIAGAVNDAVRRVDQVKQSKLKDMTGGLNIPLPKWPL